MWADLLAFFRCVMAVPKELWILARRPFSSDDSAPAVYVLHDIAKWVVYVVTFDFNVIGTSSPFFSNFLNLI